MHSLWISAIITLLAMLGAGRSGFCYLELRQSGVKTFLTAIPCLIIAFIAFDPLATAFWAFP